MRRRRLVGVFLALVSAAAGGLAFWAWDDFNAPGPLEEVRRVVVPNGTGLAPLAQLLAEQEVLRRPLVFRAFVIVDGSQNRLQAGEYDFPAGVSAAAVHDLLVAGRTVVRRLTVPEGLTTSAVLDLVRGAEGLAGDPPDPGEGRLLPETYHYRYGDSRADLLARMQRGMGEALARLFRGRSAGSPLKNEMELLTLASIVEKETGISGERARVAGVFVNRLKRGMRLQADPTVIYALTGGRQGLDRPLTRADLRVDHPYNTYRNRGLPPGPIANPGLAALEAAARPARTDALYFVADGAGGHLFARTLGEHNRNVARYRKLSRRMQ